MTRGRNSRSLARNGSDKIHEVIREYQALNDEIDKLTAPRAGTDFQTLTNQGGTNEHGFGWLIAVRSSGNLAAHLM